MRVNTFPMQFSSAMENDGEKTTLMVRGNKKQTIRLLNVHLLFAHFTPIHPIIISPKQEAEKSSTFV